MTIQTTNSPIDALRQFGIDAGVDQTFVIADDEALREVQHAFDKAASQAPADGWRFFAAKSGPADGRQLWRCSVGQAREAWPYPSAVVAL